ncbi:unnamed protein product [Cuscuta europaea]|uniref:Uncharacterized protein n=1 Tax=Cuscuta europaea TaxID=41803 RepID=A0A9P0Z348_CUSEU|nr:unnamed protein product [Cuscuta europaea]
MRKSWMLERCYMINAGRRRVRRSSEHCETGFGSGHYKAKVADAYDEALSIVKLDLRVGIIKLMLHTEAQHQDSSTLKLEVADPYGEALSIVKLDLGVGIIKLRSQTRTVKAPSIVKLDLGVGIIKLRCIWRRLELYEVRVGVIGLRSYTVAQHQDSSTLKLEVGVGDSD